MISTSDFKKGTRFEMDGEPWIILDVSSQSPSARGANTLVKTKIRNLISGQFAQRTFKSGEKFDEPDLEKKEAQYLYKDDDFFYFSKSYIHTREIFLFRIKIRHMANAPERCALELRDCGPSLVIVSAALGRRSDLNAFAFLRFYD